MEIRVDVHHLQIGLFVSDLDRPWLDTPFLLQGFLIENTGQLELLRTYCQWVLVNIERSVGGKEYWINLLPVYQRETVEQNTDQNILIYSPEDEEHISVLQLLREIFSFKDKRQPGKAPTAPSQRIILYPETHPVEVEIHDAQLVHGETRQLVSNLMTAIRHDLQPHIEGVNTAVASMVESIIRNPNALLWLTQLKNRDDYTYHHAVDTAVYMLAFGRHLGFAREDLQNMGLAGLMLDIGKMKLPEQIINKNGAYTQSEFSLMKTHVKHSLDILSQMNGIPMDVYDMVGRHHERYDGSGYPAGLKTEWIGMYGSMAGIVDCYTALTSHRNYATAKTPNEAIQLLAQWSEHFFHASLVEQFAQCVGIFHVGAIVELSSGDVGIVVAQNRARRLKPKVLLILGPDKKPLVRPQILDLMTEPKFTNGQTIIIEHELPQGSFSIDPREYFLET